MKKNKEIVNELYLLQLVQQYEDIAVQMIEWKGLSDTIPKYEPERTLYRQGQTCAFMIPGTDELAILPVRYNSVTLDIYGIPVSWTPYCVGSSPMVDIINGLKLDRENSVLIYNNQNRCGDYPYVERMCKKMVMLDDTIDINCFIQRTPVIISANGKNLLTAKNVFKDFKDGAPMIFDNSYNITQNMESLNLGVPFIGDQLSDQYETYHNRIMRYFGIDHLPVEKQERMLTGEASSNQQELEIRRHTRLAYRKKASEQINELFGLNVEVDYVEPTADTSTVLGTSSIEDGVDESKESD